MYKEINEYVFFDGVKEKRVSNSYDDWLSSSKFEIYTKSYIKVDSENINLFGETTKKIKTFYRVNEELFNQLNKKLNFQIQKVDSVEDKIFSKKYRYDDYYVSLKKTINKEYLVFYSLGGSRFVESINIYGVFIINT